MDEVFGVDNYISIIVFQKTSALGGSALDTTFDYLVWYAKEKAKLKYRQLYKLKEVRRLEVPNIPGLKKKMDHVVE